MDYKMRPTEFSPEMVESITKLLGGVHKQEWYMTDYSISRAQARGLSYGDVHHAVQHGRIIEYQYTKDSERLLLRDDYGTCIIFNLNNNCIVTAYHNDPTDNHANLNESVFPTGYQLKLLQAHYMMLQEDKENRA